mmetsp:Transcript_19619/g.59420  ORF Transcript_19619/g.59420 Transcript_19619/m.59420 type:complete len:101 (+) Transcript_19619:547-849(+)|eukprot:scaffold272576_cov28-Tisochrysis_lutea.AAC.2
MPARKEVGGWDKRACLLPSYPAAPHAELDPPVERVVHKLRERASLGRQVRRRLPLIEGEDVAVSVVKEEKDEDAKKSVGFHLIALRARLILAGSDGKRRC